MPHGCANAAYRKLFATLDASHYARDFAPSEIPAAPPGRDLLANARECPHREKIPEAERHGCDCSHRCTAGQSRKRNRAVTILECWDCPLAPRVVNSPLPSNPGSYT